MSALLVSAPAKVNLALEVLGRRPDGYHELRSVVQTIALADELTFEEASDLVVEVEGASIPPEENLVSRAARLLRASAGVERGARVRCRKRVPLAAGLGGGSSDAAATLRGLNALWGLDLPPDRLLELAARLGSDVPFFLHGGCALVAGRGETVRPLKTAWRAWLTLVPPSEAVPAKTAALYGALRPEDFSDGSCVAELARRLERGEPLDPALLVNGFRRAARASYRGLADRWDRLEAASGVGFHLTGAGPTLFSLHPTRAAAEDCRRRIAPVAPGAILTETIGPAGGGSRPDAAGG